MISKDYVCVTPMNGYGIIIVKTTKKEHLEHLEKEGYKISPAVTCSAPGCKGHRIPESEFDAEPGTKEEFERERMFSILYAGFREDKDVYKSVHGHYPGTTSSKSINMFRTIYSPKIFENFKLTEEGSCQVLPEGDE